MVVPWLRRTGVRRALGTGLSLLGFGALLLAAAGAASAISAAEAISRTAVDPVVMLALEQAQLTAPDAATFDSIGMSVALSGDTAVVGAPHKTVDGEVHAGVVYIFVRSGGAWTLQAEISDPDVHADDSFGQSVAISGDTVLASSTDLDRDDVNPYGAVFVFVRSGSTWSGQARLRDHSGTHSDLFGSAISLDGDTAVIAEASKSLPGRLYVGAVFVFARSGATWSLQEMIADPNDVAGDYFGDKVALSGDTVLVGDQHRRTADRQPAGGVVYAYVRSGTTWERQATLSPSDASVYDFFGKQVALSGDTALVAGETNADDSRAGVVYVFGREGSTWSQLVQLSSPDAADPRSFGVFVALSDDFALVGSSGATASGVGVAGAVCVYTESGSQWSLRTRMTNPAPESFGQFGGPFAISGSTVVVGDPWRNTAGVTEAGAVCVATFATTPSGWPPIVSGTAEQGCVLRCACGTWSGDLGPIFAYQWLCDEAPIVGASGPTYAVQAEDGDHELSCRVTISNAEGLVTETSNAMRVSLAPSNLSPPVISGAPFVGLTLASSTGTWQAYPSPDYRYQWLRDGVAIDGSTGSTYEVLTSDRGHRLTCRVAAVNSVGQADVASMTIRALPRPSLMLRTLPRVVKVGGSILVRGTLKHRVISSRTVTIWRRVGGKLVRLGCVKRTPCGRFTWLVRPTKSGRWILIASYTAHGATFKSNVMAVRVRPQKSASVTVP